jgi:hypothetical protein
VPNHKVWLLGTDLAEREGLRIAYLTRDHMMGFFNRWPGGECWSDSRNVTHHRWMEWYGFKLMGVGPWGHMGLSFHHYKIGE